MCRPISCHSKCRKARMALNRSDKSRILRRYFPGMTRNSEMSTEPKPKPRWDVHSPEAGNRAGNLAGVLRPLTAGPSGSGASPRFSGWPVRPGSCRPSAAPRPWSPDTDFQWPPLSPSPSPGVRRYSPTASPRCAGALSQITFSGPACPFLNWSRKAAEVPELLLPSSSIHSTSPVSRHTAE